MPSRLEAGLALLTSANGEAFGTGCVIHRNQWRCYILTSRHLVENVGGASELKWGGQSVESISEPKSGPDLALLRAALPSDVSCIRLPTEVVEVEPGTAVEILGFSRVSGEEFLVRVFPATIRQSSWIQLTADHRRLRAYELEIEGSHRLEPGHSGSPLIFGSGYVIGTLVWRQEEGKRGLAIAIEAVGALRLTDPDRRFVFSVGDFENDLGRAVEELE